MPGDDIGDVLQQNQAQANAKFSKLFSTSLIHTECPSMLCNIVSLAPKISFLTVNQPFEVTRLARQYDISSTYITFLNNQVLA